ncbi:MAG: hypothetical protein AAFU77_17575 [Myxococcota bacterium]
MFLAVCLLLGASAGPPDAELPFDVEGGMVFNPYVYAAVADVDPAVDVTAALADRIAARIRRFLLRSGYSLATVDTSIQPNGRILVVVDEGRLRRIRVLGRGSFQTLSIRFSLNLPFDVFNRPALEASLRELSSAPVRYRVVPVDEPEDQALDLSALEAVDLGTFGLGGGTGGRYELIIDLPPELFTSGWNLALGLDTFGLGFNGEYRGVALLMREDRWTARVGAATNFFQVPDSSGRELEASRIYGLGRYAFPRLLLGRPVLQAGADLVLRQRFDLGISQYSLTQYGAGIGLTFELGRSAELTVTADLIRREARLEELIEDFPIPDLVAPLRDPRGALSLDWDVFLGAREERPDRAQRFRGALTYYFPGETSRFVRSEMRYQKVFDYGWNDLWLTSAVGFAVGDFSLYDEIPVGDRYLRGVFGQQRFVQSIGALGLGYRWSLNRDLIKFGPYHDLAVFHESDFSAGAPEVRVANSLGLGLHLLLLKLFQLDIYAGGGLLSDGTVDFGTSFRVRNAF